MGFGREFLHELYSLTMRDDRLTNLSILSIEQQMV